MSLLTSAPISALAVELLSRQLVLAGTVTRVPAGEYRGPSGGTVTLALPQPRTAREQESRAAAITYDQISEVGVDVTVGHFYDAALISDEELSLDLRAFGTQVLRPQVESVARAAEDQLAAKMNGLTADGTIEWAATASADADKATVLAIRERLTVNEAPPSNRWVACAPDITTRLLDIPGFVEADKRGSATALEAAEVGQVFGLRFIESAAISAGSSIAYHRSGFALGTLAPKDPGGGADSSTASAGGVTLRHILAFDPGHLATASVVSVFAGAAVVDESPNAGAAVELATSAASDDIIDTATAHGLKAGDRVHFPALTGGTGLSVGTAYYVISANLASTSFQVSATPGGSAVNFTADITAGEVVKALPRAIKIGTAAA